MKLHVLDEQKMRQIGFTDYANERWYLSRKLADDVTLNVTISKDKSSGSVEVLDEEFCQWYDFEYILNNDPNHRFANEVKQNFTNNMIWLTQEGIVENWNEGDWQIDKIE